MGAFVYRATVAIKDFFERVGISWAVTLAKKAVSAVSQITKVS